MILNLDFYDWVACRVQQRGAVPTESDYRSLLQRCAREGFDTISFRTSVCGKVSYPSKVMTPFAKNYRLSMNGLGAVIAEWDPLAVTVDECGRNDLAVLAWITLFDSYTIGLEDAFFASHPELLMRSRDGANALRGVPCYACSQTRQYRLREAVEVSDYGVDGILYSIHSHTCCSRMSGDPAGEDVFGYNPEVVAAFADRHGVDILKEDFDFRDLHDVQGEFLTQFLRDVRGALKSKGQSLYCCVGWEYDQRAPGRYRTICRPGYAKGLEPVPYHLMVGIHLDSEKWIQEDVVDGLAAQVDDMDEIVQVKAQLGADFYVWIYCGFDAAATADRMPTIERVAAEAFANGMNGCIFHEEMSFEYYGDLWQVVRDHAQA